MTAPAATTDNAVWSSLPVPAILIDDGDRIVDVNPAAEGFLNSSAKALRGSGMAGRAGLGPARRRRAVGRKLRARQGAGNRAVRQ